MNGNRMMKPVEIFLKKGAAGMRKYKGGNEFH
jgi:hypothetical protein